MARTRSTKRADAKLTPRALYRANSMERIDLSRSGISADQAGSAAALLRITKEQLFKMLGFSKATIARKASVGATLSLEQSARLIGILSLVGQIEDAMDNAIGRKDQGFDAGEWVSNWLEQPLPALGHRKPSTFMDSTEGQMLVSRMLAQNLAGAYV